ncbi:MAG: hypothetical protein M1829_006567 [Trizodia sp. TS-e1964]|nr:MAG: hypothetical protein M1829_006567 [Trizodia sp. TS-e1964]
MIVRSRSWTPRSGDIIPETILISHGIEEREQINSRRHATTAVYDPPWVGKQSFISSFRKVHGNITPANVPEGYKLATVPGNALFRENSTAIPSSYSLVKVFVSIGQAALGISTLYLARGNQISLYGYSAFGLTVVPYSIMSLVNLLGNAITPEYPALYLVHSTVMDEVLRRITEGTVNETEPARPSFRFELVVGSLVEDQDSPMQISSTEAPRAQNVPFAIGTASIVATDNSTAAHVTLRDSRPPTDLLENASQEPEDALNMSERQLPPSLNFQITNDTSRHANPMNRDHSPESDLSIILFPACSIIGKSSKTKKKHTIESIRNEAEFSANREEHIWRVRAGGHDHWQARHHLYAVLLAIPVSLTWLAVVGGLSRFVEGTTSTPLQRAFVLAWFIIGTMIGIASEISTRSGNYYSIFQVFENPIIKKEAIKNTTEASQPIISPSGPRDSFYNFFKGFGAFGAMLIVLGYYAVPIGGAVAVVQQLMEYGTCVRV